YTTSSFHVSSVYPCTSIPCFLALARSSSVSPYIVCVQTGTPASLQFKLNVIWFLQVKFWLLLFIYKIHYLSEKKLYITKHYHELNDTGTSSRTLGLYAGSN